MNKESLRKEFEEWFDKQPIDESISFDRISDFFYSKIDEVERLVTEEIDIMISEEPINYPTPQGQEAVYGVLERLKERIKGITL